jgi:hypothetical protein
VLLLLLLLFFFVFEVYSPVVYGITSGICYRLSRGALLPQDGDGHFSEYLKADTFSSQQVGAASGNGLHFYLGDTWFEHQPRISYPADVGLSPSRSILTQVGCHH